MKAREQPLRLKTYCSLSQSVLRTKSEKMKGPRVEGALIDSNYLIRKVETKQTNANWMTYSITSDQTTASIK